MASRIFNCSILAIAGLAIGGCAKDAAAPVDVPALYVPVAAVNNEDRCAAIAAEIETLDTGLGGPVSDSAPLQPATAGQRWGSYGKNLFVQSIMGPFQPLIQTARAANNSEDKELLAQDRLNRASLRRAYLRGSWDSADCDAYTETGLAAE